MRDSFYTDSDLAQLLANCVQSERPKRIVDFACGHGALLQAAARRWPTSHFLGVDINGNVEEVLRHVVPTSQFLCQDFLSDQMPTPEAFGYFDAILLNPPFSCRGSKVSTQMFSGKLLRCSRALAFLIKSLPYLSSEGDLVAILPTSCLFSEKDASARHALGTWFNLEVVPCPHPARFRGCSVNTVLVHVQRRKVPILNLSDAAQAGCPRGFKIVRGKRANSTAVGETDLAPFVHTTELKDARVLLHRSSSAHASDLEVRGPAILLPRVGRPNVGKICLLESANAVRLSDCVVGIQHQREDALRRAHEAILSDWQNMKSLYQGTCAPYVTLKRLRTYLAKLEASDTLLSAAA